MRRLSELRLQERLESKESGRALISGFLLITVLVMVTLNLPYIVAGPSELMRNLMPVTQPFREATGVEQAWGVFAPDSRHDVIDWHARVRFADGSSEKWHIPTGDPVIGMYSEVRWRKWVEIVFDERNKGLFYEATARYAARHVPRRGRKPINVTFVRRMYPIPPPETRPPRARYRDESYYTFDLLAARESKPIPEPGEKKPRERKRP